MEVSYEEGYILLFSVLLHFYFQLISMHRLYLREDFESGTANAGWYYYPNPSTGLPEETVSAVTMATAPVALAGGGSYVGHLQDLDGSYTGSAVALNGAPTLTNYSIEADVYCYVGEATSAYDGACCLCRYN